MVTSTWWINSWAVDVAASVLLCDQTKSTKELLCSWATPRGIKYNWGLGNHNNIASMLSWRIELHLSSRTKQLTFKLSVDVQTSCFWSSLKDTGPSSSFCNFSALWVCRVCIWAQAPALTVWSWEFSAPSLPLAMQSWKFVCSCSRFALRLCKTSRKMLKPRSLKSRQFFSRTRKRINRLSSSLWSQYPHSSERPPGSSSKSYSSAPSSGGNHIFDS